MVPQPPTHPTNSLENPMKPCPECLRITMHDTLPGASSIFPAQLICGYCGWSTPIKEDQ